MDDADIVREEGLDKFYTHPDLAEACVNALQREYPGWSQWDLVVEPSAGNGAFLEPLLKRVLARKVEAVDLAPEHPRVKKGDFFDYEPPLDGARTQRPAVLFIGNPPFGKACNLAVDFFNHAAQWASAIAFIVPRTFRRVSIQNRLSFDFRLRADYDIPLSPSPFVPAIAVKCCFQIWHWSPEPRRPVVLPLTHRHWDFLALSDRHSADFAVRAVGRTGDIKSGAALAPDSPGANNWIWIKSRLKPDTLMRRFLSLDYSITRDTASICSLGRADLVWLYTQAYGS